MQNKAFSFSRRLFTHMILTLFSHRFQILITKAWQSILVYFAKPKYRLHLLVHNIAHILHSIHIMYYYTTCNMLYASIKYFGSHHIQVYIHMPCLPIVALKLIQEIHFLTIYYFRVCVAYTTLIFKSTSFVSLCFFFPLSRVRVTHR